MSIPALLEWIESTELSTAIREGALPYPIIGGIHLLGIALFGGMVLVTDLRLLGLAMRRRAVSDIVQQFQAWKRAVCCWLGRNPKSSIAVPHFGSRWRCWLW